MSVAELVMELRARGVILSARGERLAYDAPAGAMTPEVLAGLRSNKAAILAALQGEPLYRTRDGHPVHPGPMTWQGRSFWVDAGGDWWERTATGGLALRWRRRKGRS